MNTASAATTFATCTIHVADNRNGLCGKPAQVTWTSETTGKTFAECAGHRSPFTAHFRALPFPRPLCPECVELLARLGDEPTSPRTRSLVSQCLMLPVI